jgi:hypothetical protein
VRQEEEVYRLSGGVVLEGGIDTDNTDLDTDNTDFHGVVS